MRAVLALALAVFAAALSIAFPFWAWFGLKYFGLGAVAAGLAVLAAARLAAKPSRAALLQAAGALLLALAAFLLKSAAAVMLYPVLINGFLLWLFGSSLLPGRMPIVERIARLREALPPEGVRWCRQVTKAWGLFFVLNGLLALATVVIGDRDLWLAWNGCGSYVAIGAMFAGEWLLRRRLRRAENVESAESR